MKRIALFVPAIVATLLVTPMAMAEGNGDNGNNNGVHKIWICHGTSSDTNPYVKINIDESAWPAHQAEGNKYPDFITTKDAGCPEPTPSPSPTASPSPSPSPTPTVEPSPSPTPTVDPTPSPTPTVGPTPTPSVVEPTPTTVVEPVAGTTGSPSAGPVAVAAPSGATAPSKVNVPSKATVPNDVPAGDGSSQEDNAFFIIMGLLILAIALATAIGYALTRGNK